MKTFVRATGHMQGFHCWPDAPTEVDFLRHTHRHLFHYKVEVQVKHDDRQVEFFLLKAKIQLAFLGLVVRKREDGVGGFLGWDFGAKSCEMMARHLGCVLIKQGFDVHEVVVGEDDENESIVVFDAGDKTKTS